MSKKDFIRGIETATNATKDFMKKAEDGMRETANRLVKRIDESGKVTDTILEELNRQEADELYNIVIQNDIKNLGTNEKAVLCNCIFGLIENYQQNNEVQKKYYIAISNYLSFSSLEKDFNYEVIDNIDSNNDRKLIAKSICEFLFLNSGNFDSLNEFNWLFSIISIREKFINQLCSEIERIYNALGIDGILYHYTNPGEDKLYFDSIVKTEKLDVNNYIDIENIENDNNNMVLHNIASKALALSEADLECLDMTKSGDYDKPIRFYRKNISIKNALTFNSEVLFEECIIEYKIIGAAEIVAGNESKISFINCKFICKELSEEYTDKYFIKAEEDTNNQSIVFDGCVFDNCENILFINDETKLNDIIISNCFIRFSYHIFTCEGNVDSCIIKNNEALIYNTNEKRNVFSLDDNSNSTSSVKFENNLFLGLTEPNEISKNEYSLFLRSRYHLFTNNDCIISNAKPYSINNCTFINLNDCIAKGKVYNCEFINCNRPIHDSDTIKKCIFNNCAPINGSFIDSIFECEIDLCQFFNCTAPIINSDTGLNEISFTGCDFKGIKICEKSYDKVLFKFQAGYEITKIENCIFDDIELNDGVLAKCETDNKKSTIPGLIFESCSFNNLHTSRKIIIDKTAQVKTLFGKETVRTVSINNCSGLDSFDEGKLCCSHYEPEKITSDGTYIGAKYSEAEIEELSKTQN